MKNINKISRECFFHGGKSTRSDRTEKATAKHLKNLQICNAGPIYADFSVFIT